MGLDLYLYRINKVDKNRPEETYTDCPFEKNLCKTILKNGKNVLIFEIL